MQQVIQLVPEDDLASIRARMEASELSHIILVVPRKCVALQSEHGMRMLRRAADDSGSQVALVVHDEDVRDYAERLGLPAFNSLMQAQKTRWRMQPLTPDGVQSALNPPPPETSRRVALDPVLFVRRWWVATLAVVASCAILCLASALFVPAANVRIVPSSVGLSLTTDVLADQTMDAVSSQLGAIPARRITHEVSGTAQLKTTTLKSVPNALSTGTVVFTNQTSDEVEVPSGTILLTSTGIPIRFTTVTTTTVPAGINSRAECDVVAVDPGPAANVNALAINTIEGSLNLQLRVINLAATQSGSLKPVHVVTANDKQKLEAQLLAQLTKQGADLLKQTLQPGEFLAPDSVVLDTDTEVFNHSVDEPTDVLNLRITATAYGMAIDGDNLNLFATALIQKQLQAGYTLLPNGVRVDPLAGGKYNGPVLRMPFRAVGYSVPQLDPNKVARALQGKSVDDAKAYLASTLNLAQPPEINVTPLGWSRMPLFSFRIAVFVETPAVATK